MRHQPALSHFVSISDLNQEAMLALFARAGQLRFAPRACHYNDRIVGGLFYEPSTRTQLSFTSAAHRLGARYLGFSDPQVVSVTKGESLVDTIRVVQRYCDLIVLRHPSEGAARLASQVALVPIINGGDGGHEHPTQTLYDLYTIWQRLGTLQGLTIGLIGDLRFGRTVHSLAIALASFGVTLVLLAPPSLQMPPHLLHTLRLQTTIHVATQLEAVIRDLDVLYITRIQQERIPPGEQISSLNDYPITHDHLVKARPSLLVLHPLPRNGEITYDVDEDPRSMYFEQVANGVLIRMALLERMFSLTPMLPLGALDQVPVIENPPWKKDSPFSIYPCSNLQCVTHYEHGIVPRYRATPYGGLPRCVYCDQECSNHV